jgi:hypothetical protein
MGQMPANPHPDTVALAHATAAPGRSITEAVSLADGIITLAPAESSATPSVASEQVLAQFRQSGLLGARTATATPDVRLARLTKDDAGWRGRLVWAAIAIAVPDQLGAIGPGPDSGEPSGPDLITGNTVAFYDAATGDFLQALQEPS